MARATLIVTYLLLAAGGCGKSEPTTRTPDTVPTEYRQYLRDGKVVPTGHATLDYWVHINVFLATLKDGPQNDLALPGQLQTMAKFVREKPVVGVDLEAVRWTTAVAGLLETKAGIMTQLNDPGTLQRAKAAAAAGQPNPLAALDQASLDWERERDRLIAEGKRLQGVLTERHSRAFPSPQL